MSHLIATHTNKKDAQRAAKATFPFGPAFPDAIVEQTVKLEVWGSDLNDPGDDWCEFRAFDVDDRVIGERRVPGY